jgi:predicted metal-dependent peptidase
MVTEKVGEKVRKKEGKGRPKLSEEERKQIRDEIKEAVMTAAQTAGSGNLPSGVKRMIKDLTAPQLDWRALLQQQIQSTLRTDYTWASASRKGWDMDAIMPGSDFDKEIDICVAIDTSGSNE